MITQAARLYDEQDVGELIGDSDTIIMLRDVIHQLSSVTEPVLITGEHGTGKEVIARTLHLKSHRSQEPFITVNMASLPHELIGRELFGDVNDLFSKRPHEKKGLFQEIKKGTLFLDEIAEIPLEYQQSLLQILKESEMSSPHSRHDHHFQGRLIVATHKDLSREVAEGRFLEDLFYHLQVLPLHLPPLRDRPKDILPILYVWFDRITQHSLSLSSEAIHILHAHMWPGNVRELVNLTRRIGIFYPKGGDVDARFISRMLKRNPFSASSSSQTLSTQRDQDTAQQSLHSKETDHTQDPLGEDVSLEFIERLHIKRLMSRYTNISHIARILQINRRTLQRKLKAWGMENKEELKSEPKNQLKVR